MRIGSTLIAQGYLERPDEAEGANTFGGYSNVVGVTEHFVLNVPTNLDLRAVPPLVCAGVTTFSPLRHWDVRAGQKVGVVGLGGLGHMAGKLATALGAEVTVFSTSPERPMYRYFTDGQHRRGRRTTERHARGWALLYNFAPWSPATTRANDQWRCPAERLNNHRYHDDWLQNLLISASLGGYRTAPRNP